MTKQRKGSLVHCKLLLGLPCRDCSWFFCRVANEGLPISQALAMAFS